MNKPFKIGNFEFLNNTYILNDEIKCVTFI